MLTYLLLEEEGIPQICTNKGAVESRHGYRK